MAKTRTFIAIEAVDAVHSCALQAIESLRPLAGEVKWVAPENLHWTLQFLGDLSDPEVADVCRRVARVTVDLAPFSLAAQGISAFPKPDRPKTIWLGAAEGSKSLCKLQSTIEDALAELGFRGESRRYVPHITLGRLVRGERPTQLLAEQLLQMANWKGGTMTVDSVIVFASKLRRSGPEYHVLSRASLCGDPQNF